MEGIGVSASVDRVKERWVPTMKANYMLWPAVQVRIDADLSFGIFVD